MGSFVFEKKIFRKKFISGEKLQNSAKNKDRNYGSVFPAGSNNNVFRKVNEEKLLTDLLHGVVGEKMITNKLAETKEGLIGTIVKQIKIADDGLKMVFQDIIEDFYMKRTDCSESASLSLLRYQDDGEQTDLGRFAGEVLLYDKTREKIKEMVKKDSNPLDDIVNLAYEELHILQKEDRGKEYVRIYQKELQDLFDIMNIDIQRTLDVQDGLVGELSFLMAYYLFIYLSQVAMRLDRDIEGKNIDKKMFLLFKMGKESVSNDRNCIQMGWKLLEKRTKTIFPHLILLNMLNAHDNMTPYLSYSDLYQLYGSQPGERAAMDEAIDYLIHEYTVNYKHTSDQRESVDFKGIEYPTGKEGELDFYRDKIKYLFNCIEYQLVDKNGRFKVRGYYWGNYEQILKMRFVKNWGNLGKVIMISNDDLLLMIQICQRSSEFMDQELGIQISDLFYEFERRGLLFDGRSKQYIIDYLHEINLIDSKCDSEEAQYVKRIK